MPARIPPDAGKKRTTIYIDSNLWKELQHRALDEGKSASELIEDMLRKEIGGKKPASR